MKPEDILSATNGGLTIYRQFLGEIPDKGKLICNPFRDDRKPSLSIYKRGDRWRHHDFANEKYSGDAFDLAAIHYGLDTVSDWRQLLENLAADFLGEINSFNPITKPVKEEVQTKFFSASEVQESLGHSVFTHNVMRYADEAKALEVFQSYNLGQREGEITLFWYTNSRGQHCASKVTSYRYEGSHLTKKNKHTGRAMTFYNPPKGVQRLTLELFGAHLIPQQPDKTVVIVEAEDTAITCAAVWGGDFIWTACGGISLLKNARRCCIGRTVLVMPDFDVLNDPAALDNVNNDIEYLNGHGVRATLWPLLRKLHAQSEGILSDNKRAKMDARDYIEALASKEVSNA